jgi:CheY-like chemotaxis protein
VLREIKALGVHLAMDNFGAGFTSLYNLCHLPLTTLKIDPSFVHQMTSMPASAAVVKTTIAIARAMGLRIVAEGVETEAQMHCLADKRCDFMQGHYFKEPLPAAEITPLLRDGLSLPLSDAEAEASQTVLLVDDEPNILSALKRSLRHEGYRLLTAESAATALELLARHRVQVVVSDQRMPGMSGTEFLSRVKELYPDTVRLILSGYTDLQTVTEAVNQGAIYRFLTKPWEDASLRENIHEAFRQFSVQNLDH